MAGSDLEHARLNGRAAQECARHKSVSGLGLAKVKATDLGHINAQITVRPLPGSTKSWECRALVDIGATDTFLPGSMLRKLGIRPSARRSYELADGTEQELPIGFGVIEVLGRAAGSTLVFAGEKEEPLLGVTVLESTGLWLDPQRERLIPRPPNENVGSRHQSNRVEKRVAQPRLD